MAGAHPDQPERADAVVESHGRSYLDRLVSFRSYTAGQEQDAEVWAYDALSRVAEVCTTQNADPAIQHKLLLSYVGTSRTMGEERHYDTARALSSTRQYSYDAGGRRSGW